MECVYSVCPCDIRMCSEQPSALGLCYITQTRNVQYWPYIPSSLPFPYLIISLFISIFTFPSFLLSVFVFLFRYFPLYFSFFLSSSNSLPLFPYFLLSSLFPLPLSLCLSFVLPVHLFPLFLLLLIQCNAYLISIPNLFSQREFKC